MVLQSENKTKEFVISNINVYIIPGCSVALKDGLKCRFPNWFPISQLRTLAFPSEHYYYVKLNLCYI